MTDDDKSFTDTAYCFNCKYFDESQLIENNPGKLKSTLFTCESHQSYQNPKDHCSLFDASPSQLSYEEWLQRKKFTSTKTQEELDLPIITLKDRLNQGVPEIIWCVEKVLREGGITIFGGAPSSYKSFAAMELALSVAAGKDFLAQFETKKSPVLYVDEENGDVALTLRFDKLMRGKGLKLDDVGAVHLSVFNNLKLDEHDSSLRLKSLIERTGSKVIIIDSICRVMVGEEDKSKDVRRIFDTIKDVLIEYPDVSFLLLHHITKSNSKGMNSLRGSGDFAGFADVVLIFSGGGGYADVEAAKNRHIDLSQFPPFLVKPVDEGQSLKLLWLPAEQADTLVDKCCDCLSEWFVTMKMSFFKRKDAVKFAEAQNFKLSVINSAMKLLAKKRVIHREGRGLWKVVEPLVNEEDVADD